MARKRQNPYYYSSQNTPSISKKPRFKPPFSSSHTPNPKPPLTPEPNTNTRETTSMVLVTNLPHNCSVLNLKSRLEMYGGISRTRIDGEIGYVSFRSKDSAEAAISASLDPAFGITIDSQKVILSWPTDSLPQWRDGVRLPVKERLSSKLLQPEVPLSKHGRGKKLDISNVIPKSGVGLSHKAREIIAYDDLF